MDKKGIIAIVIAVSGLVAWQIYTGKRAAAYDAWRRAVAAEEAKKAEEAAKNAPPTDPAVPGVEAANPGAAPATPVAEEKVESLKTEIVDYAFTNLGGGIARATLNDQVVDKKTNAKVVLNEFGSIPIGAVSFEPGKGTSEAYTVKTDAPNRAITFERVDAKQLALAKTFHLPSGSYSDRRKQLRDEYLITLDLTFTNRSDKPMDVPSYWVHTGSAAPVHEIDSPMYIGLNYFRGSGNKFKNLTTFQAGGFPLYRAAQPEYRETVEDVRWAATANQYYTTLITPVVSTKLMSDEQKKLRGTSVWARHIGVPVDKWKANGHIRDTSRSLDGVDAAIEMAGFKLEPGASVTRQFQVLCGPSEYRRLREFDNFEVEILDFGMFGFISKTLLTSLNGLRSFLGSYWAAIMVLTVLIRSAMWPLQNRATQTAKKMQVLSPLLKELQEKHKDDPMRLQQETGKLWKEHGINPVGGCLPMFVQIPIFFGFYNMLNKAVELRNNGFLWVKDLSQPDTVAHLGSIPINILPVVMLGTMVAQMRLTPKAGDPMQQRIMMFMPLIFIALCYNYAAALALYWSVQNLFSIVQLFVTRDKNPVTVLPPSTPTPRKKRSIKP